MPEQNVVPLSEPASPVETSNLPFPETHEPAANENPQAQASAFERVVAAGKGIFEKHGVVFKRTGGRPRKDGLPNKGDVPINAPATALPAGLAANPAMDDSPGLDSKLVARCCSAVIKGFGGFLDKVLFRKALAAGVDTKTAQDLVATTAITQEEMDSFSELAAICLKKYGVGTEYAPEIGLAAVVLGVGARYTFAIKTLDAKFDAKGRP